MILVDSRVWIDYFRGTATPQTEELDSLLDTGLVAVGDLILAEVLQGFDNGRDFHSATQLLRSLAIVELGGADLALQAAMNFRLLRRRGVTIRKTIDIIIATRCIADRCDLLHNDRDFDPFVKHLGLRVVR